MNKDCTCKTSILQPTPDPRMNEPHPATIAWIIVAYLVGCVAIGYGIAAFTEKAVKGLKG
jgi:hypothetical protein